MQFASELVAQSCPSDINVVLTLTLRAEDQTEQNGTPSTGTAFPAVTFPGGFSPVGTEDQCSRLIALASSLI